MSRNYKFRNPKGLYFISTAVVNWIEVFAKEIYKNVLIESLTYCQKEKGMEIIAWCIMTNHIHIVFRSNGERNPEMIIGDFKRYTSKKIVKSIIENEMEDRKNFLLNQFMQEGAKSSNVKNYQFWQHDSQPIELWSNYVISQKVNYIHQNPVKAGFVSKAEEYKYCSALDYAGGNGLIPNIIIVSL